jgi:hypothetical protein
VFDKTAILALLLIIVSVKAQAEEDRDPVQQQLDQQQAEIDALRSEIESLKNQNEQSATHIDTSQAEEADNKFVLRKTPNGEMTLSGRIHRVIMQLEDGVSTNDFFMDSDQALTMLRTDVKTSDNNDWIISGALEVGLQSNRPFDVSQDNPNPGTDIRVREANVNLENEKLGKFSLGRGFSAAWVVSEYDLSGTSRALSVTASNRQVCLHTKTGTRLGSTFTQGIVYTM